MKARPEPHQPDAEATASPSPSLANGALGLILLWNALAGFFAARRPGSFGGEFSLMVDRFGVLAPSAPTAQAGLWLAAWGLLGVVLARRRDARWHAVAGLFYAVQVIAVLQQPSPARCFAP